MKYKYTDEQFREAVKNSLSIAQVAQALGIKAAGGNYTTIKNKIKELNLDTSHFTGQGWNTGTRYRQIRPTKSLDSILIEHSAYVNTYHLKERLIKEGVKENKCEICGISTWMDKPLNMELHHINGDHTDLRIENLQMLCPNCHALTDNYRGKAKSTQDESSDVNAG